MILCDYCNNEKDDNMAEFNIQSCLQHYRIDNEGNYGLIENYTEEYGDINAHLCDACYEKYLQGELDLN